MHTTSCCRRQAYFHIYNCFGYLIPSNSFHIYVVLSYLAIGSIALSFYFSVVSTQSCHLLDLAICFWPNKLMAFFLFFSLAYFFIEREKERKKSKGCESKNCFCFCFCFVGFRANFFHFFLFII